MLDRPSPGGPVASQEAIKELGTNGGGFYNANSAHPPFENPTTWTNWIEIFLLLVISFSMPRMFGRMVDSKKQGYAIVAVMGVIALLSTSLMLVFQMQHHGTVPTAVGAASEGVEQRFGGVRLGHLRQRHHPHLDGRRGLLSRLVHQPRRHDDAVQHATRRGRPPAVRVPVSTAC